MRSDRASFTAAFVAACRGLASALPPRARLVTDPYGAHLVHPRLGAAVDALAAAPSLARAAAWVPLAPLAPWVAYMQVRTHALDECLRAALESGCAQVVILGAGFDARATRLAPELGDAAVYEVDHPATQAQKRSALARMGAASAARYLSWDFERDALCDLPAALAAAGHDPSRPTFTLWEGVTMYLTPEAIAASLAAVRAYSARGSRLAFNYIDRAHVERPTLAARAVAAVVGAVGEPFRGGLDPAALPDTMARAGFVVERDAGFDELAAEVLPAPWRWVVSRGRRFAVVERTATVSAP